MDISAWLAATLLVLATGNGVEAQNQALPPGQKLSTTEERIRFLLGTPACQLKEIFWDDVSPVAGMNNLHLGLYEVQRKVDELWIPGDILALLVAGHLRTEDPRIWLRAGPTLDTGWIEIKGVVASNEKRSPLRDCFRKISSESVIPSPANLGSEARYFLSPLPPWDADVQDLVVSSSESKRSPLGRHGISSWLLDSAEDLGFYRASEDKDTKVERTRRLAIRQWQQGFLPASSSLVLKTIIWREGQPTPVEEIPYLTPARPIPAPTHAHASNEDTYSPPVLVGPPPRPNCDFGKIFGLRAMANDGASFKWSWVGLPGAAVSHGDQFTDSSGCLLIDPGKDSFNVALLTKDFRFWVEAPQAGIPTANVEVQPGGPFVFVRPGAEYLETVLAANIFIWTAEGMAAYDRRIFPWLSSQIQDLRISQGRSPGGYPCAGFRQHQEVFFPLACPGDEGFVPKGLCGDLILHELSHEMMGSLVGLASGGRVWEVKEKVLNEALADFFAMTLRETGPADGFNFARNCQNDSKRLRPGGGHKDQDYLVLSLFPRRTDRVSLEGEVLGKRFDLIGRLASLAVMFESDVILDRKNSRGFLPELLGLADKAKIPEEDLKSICSAIVKFTGYCDPICVNRVPCEQDLAKKFSDPSFFTTFSSDVAQAISGDVRLNDTRNWDIALLKNGSLEAVEQQTKSRKRIEIGIWPGFTENSQGTIEGWSTQGQAIKVRRTDLENQTQPSGMPTRFDRSSIYPLPGPGIAIQENPRLEILEVNSLQIRTAYWNKDDEAPIVSWQPWEHSIDVRSIQYGLEMDGGATLMVKEVPVSDEVFYIFRDGKLTRGSSKPNSPRPPQYSAFPIESPPGVMIRHGDGKSTSFSFEESLCQAPPFLSFLRREGSYTLLALTCDGVVTSFNLDPPSIAWQRYIPGIVSPVRGIRPIHHADVDGNSSEDWILGPFRGLPPKAASTEDESALLARTEGKTMVDRIYIWSPEGNPVVNTIELKEPVAGSLIVSTAEGPSGCSRVVLATGVRTEVRVFPGTCATPP